MHGNKVKVTEVLAILCLVGFVIFSGGESRPDLAREFVLLFAAGVLAAL